ncbi:MAG: hypothetical protein JHD16_05480 [Solirubrobacteraceae bacterium]|nr:hypothetical protein [Solirubrobacteraceae bacterium]
MTHPSHALLRRAIAVAAIASCASLAPAAVASPGTKSTSPKRGPAADLVVRDLDVEFGSDTLMVYADVVNIGNRKAQRRSEAVVAISGDEILDDDDEIVDDPTVRRLGPNGRYELETEVDVPADEDLPSGDVYLLVCADGYDAVREKNEANNCAAELIASDEEAVDEDDAEDAFEDDDSDEESGEDFPVTDER